jgi:CRP/FNR family cyclic AMP-dependent transcriptional regulator
MLVRLIPAEPTKAMLPDREVPFGFVFCQRRGSTLAADGPRLRATARLAMQYEVAAQAIGMVRVRAFKRKDFQQFMAPHGEGSLHAAEMLNQGYRAALSNACRMALSGSVAARMARLLLDMAR